MTQPIETFFLYKMSEASTPSLLGVAIAAGLVCLTAGYFIGSGSSLGLFDSSGNPEIAKKSWPNNYDVKVHADSSDEEDGGHSEDDEVDSDEDDGNELKGFEDSTDEVKLVLAVRTDLGMTKGKSCCGYNATGYCR